MERFGLRRVVAASLLLVAARLRADPGDDRGLAAVAALGLRGRHRHRLAGAGLRRDRRQPLVRRAPRPRHRRLLGRQLHRPAGLPAGHRAPGRGPGLAVGRRPGHGASRCSWCRSCWLVLRDQPADVGTTPYGAPDDWAPPPPVAEPDGAARLALTHPARERRGRARSGSCSCTFWICGWSTNGLIGTHFIPAAHDHGMPRDHQRQPARPDRDLRHRRHGRERLAHRPGRQPLPAVRLLLLPRAVPAGRAVAARPARRTRACSCSSSSTAWTGWRPCRPRSPCAASTSGSSRSGVVFGWVFASHMVGAGVAASYAGWIRHRPGRLLRRLDDRRRALPRRGRPLPPHPAVVGSPTTSRAGALRDRLALKISR